MEKELIDGIDDLGLMSEINVTPFIDIMLVLLIIFMVTAPLMLGGVHVNLPKTGGDPMPRPENPTIVSLDAALKVFVDKEEIPTESRHEYFQKLARESETGEIYVRGDGEVKYAQMMELMGELGQAGFARVTLVTDVRGGRKGDDSTPAADGADQEAGAPAVSTPIAQPAGSTAAQPAASTAPALPPAVTPLSPSGSAPTTPASVSTEIDSGQ